jgi:hypothetical protein
MMHYSAFFFALQLIVVLVEKKYEVNMGNFGKK